MTQEEMDKVTSLLREVAQLKAKLTQRDEELKDLLRLGKQRSDQQEEHIQRLLKALVLIRDFDEDGDFDDPGQVAEYYLSQFT